MYFLEQKLTQNKTASAFLKKAFQRYFIDAMGAMALGLFSSLIIGLILSQLSKFSFLGFLEPYAAMVSASSPLPLPKALSQNRWFFSPARYPAHTAMR